MKQLAFVGGATGFTGRAVVARCAQLGLTTWAHVRPDSAQLETWRKRFAAMGAEVDTTPWEPDMLRERLRHLQPTLVFALLGTTQARAKREGLQNPYEAVDYGMSVMLIDAAAACQPQPRVVYLSSTGTSAGAWGAYLKTRWRVEQHLRASGVPMSIARPAMITGQRDEVRPAERFAEPLTSAVTGALRLVGARRMAARYAQIDGEGLAHALVQVGLDPAGQGKIYEGEDLQERRSP